MSKYIFLIIFLSCLIYGGIRYGGTFNTYFGLLSQKIIYQKTMVKSPIGRYPVYDTIEVSGEEAKPNFPFGLGAEAFLEYTPVSPFVGEVSPFSLFLSLGYYATKLTTKTNNKWGINSIKLKSIIKYKTYAPYNLWAGLGAFMNIDWHNFKEKETYWDGLRTYNYGAVGGGGIKIKFAPYISIYSSLLFNYYIDPEAKWFHSYTIVDTLYEVTRNVKLIGWDFNFSLGLQYGK